MSGTSADGADVALIATDGEDSIEFFGGLTLPYDRELRARVLEASVCARSTSKAVPSPARCRAVTRRSVSSCAAEMARIVSSWRRAPARMK